MSWYLWVRWVHLFSATAWLGEVVTINFVLVPVLLRMKEGERIPFLAGLFPSLFRLASWLSGTAVLSGAVLITRRHWGNWSVLWTTGSGRYLLAGATLALGLAIFHFILEPRLEGMICTAEENEDIELTQTIVRRLKIVPRTGMVVLVAAFWLMMVANRGM